MSRASSRWYWRSKTNRNKVSKRQAKLRLKRRQNGLCYRCGKNEAVNLCTLCADKEKNRAKNYRIQRAMDNLCSSCGIELPEGHKTIRCSLCLSKQRETMRRKREDRESDLL